MDPMMPSTKASCTPPHTRPLLHHLPFQRMGPMIPDRTPIPPRLIDEVFVLILMAIVLIINGRYVRFVFFYNSLHE